MNSRFFRSIFFAIAVTAFCGNFYQIDAQTGVDPTYIGVPSVSVHPPDNVPSVFRQAIQADGKILIWGGALAVEGIAKGRLARLNADGTLDNSFTYCHCGIDGLNNAAPLPDGKILVGGHAANISKVIRLNNDGSLDTTFNYVNPPNAFGNSSATVVAVQPDGRFFATRSQASQGFTEMSLFHFNADGSLDTAFTAILIGSGSPNRSSLGALKVLPDGRVYVAINTFAFSTGFFTSLKRHTTTGETDPTWETPTFGQPPTSGGAILGIDTQTDGSVVVAGTFQVVNGLTKPGAVRLMPAGNVDMSFSPPVVLEGTGVKVLSNGKILYSHIFGLGDGVRMMRLLSDGTQDNTYAMETGLAIRNPWVIDASEQVIFLGVGLTRLLVNGARDTSFNPNIGHYGRVQTLARQADGKVIVAGEFTSFNGVPSISLARTNIDGTLDATYNAGTGFNGIPNKMLVQPDGKLLVIGSFSSYNGTAVPGIVRIMSDGTIDPLFSVTPTADSELLEIELQSDGRIFIAGSFTTVNGTSRPGVARLNADGTLDNSFNALLGGSPRITAVVVQPDNKVLVGGTFTGVGGFNRSNFARVDSTGALDQSFNPANTTAGRIYLTSGGKILTTHSEQGFVLTVIRRNSDGSLDTSFTSVGFQHTFNSGTTRLESILARPDGSIIVGGFFNQIGSSQRTGIVRLTPNGSVDPLFLPNSSDGRVRSIVDGGAGKVLIGGDFTRVENTTKAGLARLNVEPFRKTTPFDFNGDGRADFAVFRPSTNQWYRLMNSTWEVFESTFGLSGDIVAPGDFDGDGRTDLAIYRPSAGAWWYAASSLGGAHRSVSHGINGDIPRPSDFDGDGKTDYVVYRPSNGTWFRMNSTGQTSNIAFGAAGDQPVIGDFDGDGKSDPAIFRPSTGDWWYAASGSGNQHRAVHWGQTGDLPAPADFDGDGKTDFAVYRPSNGGWYIVNSSNGSFVITGFGVAEDRPIPADYDGDGRADIAVFRPSTGVWYLMQSTSGIVGVQFGVATDIAIPNSYVPQAP